MRSHKGKETFRIGDTVGIPLKRVNRAGDELQPAIVCKGTVTQLYQQGRGPWRARVVWNDKVKAFLYTGKDGWEYCSRLALIERYPFDESIKIRRGRSIKSVRGYQQELP